MAIAGHYLRNEPSMQDAASKVIIIGGGLSGLAAAVALAERNIPAVVLESRGRLGGRASSFVDPTTGEAIDNCQHVAMGCCTNFAHFLQTVGLQQWFRRERALHFIGPGTQPIEFSADAWPCPFHLLRAFRRLRYLSTRDQASIAFGLKALANAKNKSLDDQPFSDWLKAQRQPQSAVDWFWQVVLVSALSESLDRISVPQARKVFVDGFLRHRDGWCVDIPNAPLEEIYGSLLVDWLSARGVEVALQSGVEKLQGTPDNIEAVLLRDGTALTASDFILTVPWHRVADLLPEACRDHPAVSGLSQLESAPITSIHLWLDRQITDLPHAVLVGRLSQWMFRRSARDDSSDREHYYQVVISASRDLSSLSHDEILQRVLAELADVWPDAGGAKLLHHRIVTERRAVFSVKPGTERLRPPQQSPIPNLQWAGDWTRTGWPGTMEGAVRSGYLAVENVLRRRGRGETVLRPDLPTAFWSRWLFGIS